jgi:hypothetical protein
MLKNKLDISVKNNAGIRVKPDIIVGESGSYSSGDILDANAVEKVVTDKIGAVVGNAVEALDTLEEVGTALGQLSTVATTGSYDDLTDTPTIPVVPTDVSSFNNDAGYLTSSDISSLTNSVTNIQNLITADESSVDQAIDKFEEIVTFLNGIAPGSELYNIINSHIDNGSSGVIKHVEVLTQSEFNQLLTKDANTEYNII